MHEVIQCEGCGEDVVIKRGGYRLCKRCKGVERRSKKHLPKKTKPERVPIYDALGFVIGFKDP